MTLDRRERRVEDLPLLASTVAHLSAISIDDDTCLQEIYEIAEADPVLALKVVQMANRATIKGRFPVFNLKDAIARIGLERIYELENSVAVTHVFCPVSPREKELWFHSIQVASLCRNFFQSLKQFKICERKAYFCGLVHDIGSFVLFRDKQEEFNQLKDHRWESIEEILTEEDEIMEVSHTDLGKHICTKLYMPGVISEVVKRHHEYGELDHFGRHPKVEALIRIIQISDIMSLCYLNSERKLSTSLKIFNETIDTLPKLQAWMREYVSFKELSFLITKGFEEADTIYARLRLEHF